MLIPPEFHPDSFRARWLFARTFLKQPKLLGSVIPSSRWLRDRLLSQVPWQAADTIVEYGPGVGTLTTAILERMPLQAKLVVIEMNPDFVRYLCTSIADPRLIVECGSAVDVCGILRRHQLPHADCIISGIPFSTLPLSERERILQASRKALRPGGLMLAYQFSRAVVPPMKRIFNFMREELELLNVLPARIYVAERPYY